MKKFKFRLQAILDIRQKELEKKQQEMASILQILNQQTERLNAIQAEQEEILTSLNNLENGQILDIEKITNSNSYLVKLTNDIVNQSNIIENTKRVMLQKQYELNEIYKKVKTLEKLKENQEKEYYEDIDRKITKEIDDIVTTRYKAS